LQPSPRRPLLAPPRRQPLPKPAFGSSPNLQVGAVCKIAQHKLAHIFAGSWHLT
jgi:hypothetical protein